MVHNSCLAIAPGMKLCTLCRKEISQYQQTEKKSSSSESELEDTGNAVDVPLEPRNITSEDLISSLNASIVPLVGDSPIVVKKCNNKYPEKKLQKIIMFSNIVM